MEQISTEVLKAGLLEVQSRAEETLESLGLFQRIAEAVSSGSGTERLCRDFTRVIIEQSEFENCSILLWDEGMQCLRLVAAFGLRDLLAGGGRSRYHTELTFGIGEGIAGRVFEDRCPYFVEEASSSQLRVVQGATVHPASLACLPLNDLGVINLSSYRPLLFPPAVRRYWSVLAGVMARFIAGTLVYGETAEQACGSAVRSGRNVPKPADTAAERAARTIAGVSTLAMDQMPQGVALLDERGNASWVNRSLRSLQGMDLDEMAGRKPSIFFIDPKNFDELFETAVLKGQSELAEVSLVNSKGDVYLADLFVTRLSEGSCYLFVVDDVTKKKAFADKILRKEKLAALGTMAGGVSHDFNNLLMAILGNIQLMLPRVQDEEVRRRLENIEKAVHDGSHTVRRLQKFTERERETQAAVVVDVCEAIRDVVEWTRPRWKDGMEKAGHIIRFELDLAPECSASIHASDLREVLTNLIFNAVEAMPEGGGISIRSRVGGESVVVEVSDTGIGMSREVAAKIFDPFYSTKGVGNSGLGLSVSWSLVARNGGELLVRSKPGKGSTFIIRLPRAATNKSASASGAARDDSRTYRLLVVDDDENIMGILRDMLRLKGHRVKGTHDAREALELLDNEEFDLVLTDLGMPVVSGWEVARCAKEKNPKTPVILITGWGAQYEEDDLASKGVDTVLAKPLSWDKLLLTVDKALTGGL